MDTETAKIDDRLGALEGEVGTIKCDVAVIKSNYVTKEDLQRELSAATWRILTFVCGFFSIFSTLLVSATYFISTVPHWMDTDSAKVDERLGTLEREVAFIKCDVSVIKANYATREDLQRELGATKSELLKEMNRQTWRFISFTTGVAAAIVSATYFIATHTR